MPDINDVKDDISSYKSAFERNPNCHVIINDFDATWTQKSLLKYFENSFNEYLFDSSTRNIKYNSLIITLSGHCTETSIICSNGKRVQFTEILSICTNQWENKNLVANLPKFIFVDGQRGFYHSANPTILSNSPSSSEEDEKHSNNDEENERDLAEILMEKNIMDTYSCVMCSVSAVLDSTAYSGQLSWNLSQILKDVFSKQQDIIFYDIVSKLRQRINHIGLFRLLTNRFH